MKKYFFLTYACLIFSFVPPVFANDDNASPSPATSITTEQSSTVNTSQSGGNNNNNVNVNNNSNSQSQSQENHQSQDVNITNNAQPAVLGVVARPKVLPATGPSLFTYALMLSALPIGLILRRHKAKN